MKGHEFEAMLRNGQKPVVIFQRGVEDQEGYLEPGMRGRIVAVRDEDDDLLSFTVDLTEFESFNLLFESSNYFDKAGNPCLTAREAALYKPTESLWGTGSGDVPMRPENADRLALFTKYQKSNVTENYVQWLEDMVLASSPEAQVDADLYKSACDSVEEWKARAMKAEEVSDRLMAEINDMTGPTFMGEPVLPANAVPDAKAMADRLMGWRLPDDFAPYAGISFTPSAFPHAWPTGTNLLTAAQAEQTFSYVLATAPSTGE